MSNFVLDASLALQWLLEDEADRQYGLSVLASLSHNRAFVPPLWFYEVGNALVVAHRRKRISFDQVRGFLDRLKTLPIDSAPQSPSEILKLPLLAQTHVLTNYDAAYLALSLETGLPIATADRQLRKAAMAAGAKILEV